MKILLLPLLIVCVFSNSVSAQDPVRSAAIEKATKYSERPEMVHDTKRNLYISKGNIIHIFMLEDGQLLLSGYPTTATDKNLFQLHIFTNGTNSDTYIFDALGSYEPALNIEGAEKALDKAGRLPIEIKIEDMPIVGPFTGSVQFVTKRNGNTISNATIKLAKTIHASIGSGFVYSTLRNPTNIRTVRESGKDTTLMADNQNGNATLTVMATLYPWGKNSLMMPSRSFKDRGGIVVGTTIASSSKNFKNVYLGIQYDFAVGGSFVIGADIADRQKIRGIKYKDFEFGETKFSGNLNDKLYKEIGIGLFIGVQVDSRIFSKLFTD